MQTYTDGRSEGHQRSREARLLQPDKVTAISAFGEIDPIQNLKNNPMHRSLQTVEAQTKNWIERRCHDRNSV
jgi:hypothetical protein